MRGGKGILWVIFRNDEDARPDDERVARFAEQCLLAYEKRVGRRAEMLGVASSFPAGVAERLRGQGVAVVHNLPAWMRCEVWVGAVDAEV